MSNIQNLDESMFLKTKEQLREDFKKKYGEYPKPLTEEEKKKYGLIK